MAIYHLSVKTVSRSSGRSAVAAAAYRAGAELVDQRTGVVHNYTRKQGVISTDLILPAGVDYDRGTLWNAAEKSETRKNSTVAREFEIALPHELDAGQRRELVLSFASELVERHGCAADVAIHAPDTHEGTDSRNYHAHILLTTRRVTADGFKEKTRELDDRKTGPALVTEWRARWAELQNNALEGAFIAARVDHRSYAMQQITLLPTKHLGPAANDMERNGKLTEKGDHNRTIVEHNAVVIELAELRKERDRQLALQEKERAKAEAMARLAQAKASYLAGRAEHEERSARIFEKFEAAAVAANAHIQAEEERTQRQAQLAAARANVEQEKTDRQTQANTPPLIVDRAESAAAQDPTAQDKAVARARFVDKIEKLAVVNTDHDKRDSAVEKPEHKAPQASFDAKPTAQAAQEKATARANFSEKVLAQAKDEQMQQVKLSREEVADRGWKTQDMTDHLIKYPHDRDTLLISRLEESVNFNDIRMSSGKIRAEIREKERLKRPLEHEQRHALARHKTLEADADNAANKPFMTRVFSGKSKALQADLVVSRRALAEIEDKITRLDAALATLRDSLPAHDAQVTDFEVRRRTKQVALAERAVPERVAALDAQRIKQEQARLAPEPKRTDRNDGPKFR